MKTEFNQLDQEKSRKAYKVPEGYFENLSEQIMSQLPERKTPEKPHSISRRMRPWMYAAAVFMGMVSIYTILMNSLPEKDAPKGESTLVVQSNVHPAVFSNEIEEDEEYLEYLENKYTNDIFSNELSSNME